MNNKKLKELLVELNYSDVKIKTSDNWVQGYNKHGQIVACQLNDEARKHFRKWSDYNKNK